MDNSIVAILILCFLMAVIAILAACLRGFGKHRGGSLDRTDGGVWMPGDLGGSDSGSSHHSHHHSHHTHHHDASGGHHHGGFDGGGHHGGFDGGGHSGGHH